MKPETGWSGTVQASAGKNGPSDLGKGHTRPHSMSPQQEDREQGGLNWLLFSCVTSQKPLRAARAGAGETIGIGFRLLNLVQKLKVWLAPANQVWAGLGNVCCPFFAGIQEKHAIRSLF